MAQYNDPSFFNHEYEKYKSHLAASSESDAESVHPSTASGISRNASDISDDRNQDDIHSLA